MTQQTTVEHVQNIYTQKWVGSNIVHNGQRYRYDGGTKGGRLYNMTDGTKLVKIFNHGKHFLAWVERLEN